MNDPFRIVHPLLIEAYNTLRQLDPSLENVRHGLRRFQDEERYLRAIIQLYSMADWIRNNMTDFSPSYHKGGYEYNRNDPGQMKYSLSEDKFAENEYDASLTAVYEVVSSAENVDVLIDLNYGAIWNDAQYEELLFALDTFVSLYKSRIKSRDVAVKLAAYKAIVSDDPLSLLTAHMDGMSFLERAINNSDGEEVVAFLEEKTNSACSVFEAFGDLSREEFKLRFEIWESL